MILISRTEGQSVDVCSFLAEFSFRILEYIQKMIFFEWPFLVYVLLKLLTETFSFLVLSLP